MSLSGLYAVTSEAVCEDPQRLVSAVSAALAGGARLIQYRDKRASAEQREERAKRLLRLCHDAGAALIINDDTELALRSGADGVHLGASDGAIRNARLRLGPRAIIGRSCSGSLERAQAAAAEGADSRAAPTLTPGPTFSTGTARATCIFSRRAKRARAAAEGGENRAAPTFPTGPTFSTGAARETCIFYRRAKRERAAADGGETRAAPTITTRPTCVTVPAP